MNLATKTHERHRKLIRSNAVSQAQVMRAPLHAPKPRRR